MKKLISISSIKDLKELSTQFTAQVKGGSAEEGDRDGWILVTNSDGTREWRRSTKV